MLTQVAGISGKCINPEVRRLTSIRMTGFVDFPLPVDFSSSTTFAVLPPDFIQKKRGFPPYQPQACRKESKNAVLTISNAVDTFAPHPTVGTCTLSTCVPDPCHALLPPPPPSPKK